MPDKILFNIKDDAFNNFFIMYIGARQLSVNITKSSLITQIMQNSINEKLDIMKDCNNKLYTGKDLYNLGLSCLQSFFNLMESMPDSSFYKKLKEIGINNDNLESISFFKEIKNNEEKDMLHKFALEEDDVSSSISPNYNNNENELNYNTILQRLLKETSCLFMDNNLMVDTIGGIKKSINLSNGDYENIVKVITYHDNSTICLKNPEYTFNKEINKLFTRIKSTFAKLEHYKFLSNIILDEFNKSNLSQEYKIYSNDSSKRDREIFNINIELYNKMLNILKNKVYSNDEVLKLANYYKYIALERIESNKCNKKCNDCFFNAFKCYPQWAFEDMKELLCDILSLDITRWGNDTFTVTPFNDLFDVKSNETIFVSKI